jgi:hypothetical protein
MKRPKECPKCDGWGRDPRHVEIMAARAAEVERLRQQLDVSEQQLKQLRRDLQHAEEQALARNTPQCAACCGTGAAMSAADAERHQRQLDQAELEGIRTGVRS